MRSGIRALLFGALFSLGIAGCSCGEDPAPPSPKPNPVFTPESFAFDGLCAGGSLRQELLVENKGRGRLNAHVTFEGEAASSFRLERDGETVTEFAIDALRSATFEVVYEPKAPAGEQEVWMVISWGEEEKEILLTGFLSSNPLEPRVAGTWEVCEPVQDCPSSITEPCCWAPSGSDHQGSLHFGKVGAEHSTKVDLRFENRGCEPVRITSVELLPSSDDCGANDVSIEFPEEGIEIPGAVDVTRAAVAVEFRPSSACALDREIVVQTTDPANPTFRYRMQGQGVAGSLQVEAPFIEPVQFGSVRKNQSKDLPIPLVNAGTDSVVVTGAELAGDDAEHFEILRLEQCGGEVGLPLEVHSVFDVCNSPPCDDDRPPACAARIVVTTRYAPKGPGRHGLSNRARILLPEEGANLEATSVVRLLGDSEPKFKAYPSQRIAFGSPTLTGCGTGYECGECKNLHATCTDDAHCGEGERCVDNICTRHGSSSGAGFEPEAMCATSCGAAERSFMICNEDGYNDLVIGALKLFDLDGNEGGPIDPRRGQPIFEVDPGDCQGAIEPDACCAGSITLVDTIGGGVNNAVLAVESNRGSEVYEIDVQKITQVIHAPVIEGFTVTNNPRVNQPVVVQAHVTTEHGGVSQYVWRVKAPSPGSKLYIEGDPIIDPQNPDAHCKKPGGVGCFELLNAEGHACSPDGSDCSTLIFYPDMGGSGFRWEFTLDVYSDICDAALWSSKQDDLEVSET